MEDRLEDLIQPPAFDLEKELRAEAKNRRGKIYLGAAAVLLLALAEIAAFMGVPGLAEDQTFRYGAALALAGGGVLLAACVPLGMRKERRRG